MPRRQPPLKRTLRMGDKKALKKWIHDVSRYLLKKPKQSGSGLFDEIMLPEIKNNQMLSQGSKWAADNSLGFIPGIGNIARGVGYLGSAGFKALGYGKRKRPRRMHGGGEISDFIASKLGQHALSAVTKYFG